MQYSPGLVSEFARCSHECRRCLRFPKDQQSFIKVRKFLFLTGLEDSPDQVRLENQTNLNLSVPRQRLLGPKTSSTLFCPGTGDQSFPISQVQNLQNDGSRVTHNPSAMCLVVWFSLESVEILLSGSRNADCCMCKPEVLF